MNEKLEREVLENVLDSDAVQHLLINIENKGIATKEEALDAVNQLASAGYLKFSQYDRSRNIETDMDQRSLKMTYVLEHTYTFVSKTERTIGRLNELTRASSSRPS